MITKAKQTKKQTFMLIGVGKTNVPIIAIAKKTGYQTIVTDIKPDAEGLKHGDFNYNISAKDIEGLALIAEKHEVDLIYSGTDVNFGVGVLNMVRGIDGFPLILGLASENKGIFRKIAAQAGMPLTRGQFVHSQEKAVTAFKELGKNAVIKATNLCSSKGIKKVSSVKEVMEGYEECCSLSNSRDAIVEEFITATCHDVNGMMLNGKFYPCGIVDRSFISNSNYFVQQEMTCPTLLDRKVQEQMYSTMARFARYLKVHTTPLKADFMFDGKNIYLLEYGPRFHGSMGFLHMIPGATNIRAMEAYLKYRHSGILDKKLLEENVIDRAVCKADIQGMVKSNYDVKRYVISFNNKQDIVVTI